MSVFSFAEDYDEDKAVAHVRRLLDIVACTTNFGHSSAAKNVNSHAPPPTAAAVDGDGEISQSCPRLGSFYEFFSLSHLTPPFQCTILFLFLFEFLFFVSVSETPDFATDIKKTVRRRVPEILEADHLFSFDVNIFTHL